MWRAVGNEVFNAVQDLIAVRRRHLALRHGDWRLLAGSADALLYERAIGSDRNVAGLNTKDTAEHISGLGVSTVVWHCGDVSVEGDVVGLGPRSGAVLA